MKNFLKLLNFELNRFLKLYIVLLIVIAIIQITGVIIRANMYMGTVTENVVKGGMSQQTFLDMYSPFNMLDVIYSMWFMAPIAIGAAALLFYLFFIWYRDWFAKNTFIYRLLMLPTSRMNVFFAKAVTIMLTVLGLVAFQVVLLLIESTIMKWIVPIVYRVDLSVAEIMSNVFELSIILPQGLMEFFVAYGLGFAFVVVMFTAILMERSFKLKGIVIGVIYIGLAIGLFFLPLISQIVFFENVLLYADEVFFIELFIWLL